MIIIFAIFLTTVFAKQDKYSNQKFLDNVSRRESFETNGTNNEHREMIYAQLNEHNSYVQSVMEQETTAFKAQRNKREDRPSEEDNKSKENDDSKAGLEVNPFQFRDIDVDKLETSADNIGLTVTGLNHPSYDKTPQDNLTDNSKVDNVTEETLSLQTTTVTIVVNREETTEASTKQNLNEEKGKSILDSETQMQNSEPVASTTETQQLKIENTNTFENNSQFETASETYLPLSVTATSSIQEVENAPTETTKGSKIQLEYDPPKTSDNFEPSSNATESYTKDSSDDTLSSSLTDESTTNSVIDTTTNKKSDLPTTLNSQVFATATQNTAEVNTATTENYSEVTEDHSTKNHLQTEITETTTFTPILTTSNIEKEQRTKKPKILKLSKTIKQPDNDILVSYVASKALKNIKHELELKKQGTFIDNEIEITNKVNTHLNHYRVYEIPWPIKRDNQPFLRNQESIKEQRYFVPIYKYSPKFAYYNPKNRLGPNEMVENLIKMDTHLRDGNNVKQDKVEPSEFILQLNNELRKFGIYKRRRPAAPKVAWNIRTVHKKDEKEDEDKTKEVEETTAATMTTLQDVIKSDEEIIDTTPAPTTNVFGFTGFDCNSADTETAAYCESSKKNKNDNEKKGQTIAGILSVADETDVFITFEKLQALGLPLMRSKPESKVNIYMNVLKDLLLEDSKSLKQYDWLTTTVQIQSALTKILKLIKRVKQSKQLYPADLQILRYIVFLHNFSLEIRKDKLGNNLRKVMELLPSNIKNWKNKSLKKKGLINRDWLYLKTPQSDLVENDGLSHLHEFLIDVQDGLFDLHEAIRYIANVIKFDRQDWYGNLKQLYLSADEKQLRELLLHISMSRLVDLVEHSSKHSLDDGFIQFVKSNKKDAKRIVEEMIFVNEIVDEILINRD